MPPSVKSEMPSVAAVSLVRDFFKIINFPLDLFLWCLLILQHQHQHLFSASTSGSTSTTSYIQSFYQKVRELAAEAGLTPLHLAAYSGLKKKHIFFSHYFITLPPYSICLLPKSSKSSIQQCSIIRFNHVSQMLLDVSHCYLIHAIIFDCGWISMANLSAYDYSYLPHPIPPFAICSCNNGQ